MPKLKMHSLDNTADNIAKIAVLFPNCITERKNEQGELEQAIDFDVLKQELSKELIQGNEERYQFTWPDKKQSILQANLPIKKTLRPCKEESVNFDTTQNVYIEGDNLEVLKILKETYLNKIKMIYIDPPYNTGKDFVYKDNFHMDGDDFSEASGQYDDEGHQLYDMRQNNESNGRFHTDWLNMIYPRLKLARSLLSDDGVIFISIDDNEVHNLRKICDEIFGAGNFVANIIWEKKYSPQNDAKYFTNNADIILMYAKLKDNLIIKLLPRNDEQNSRYKNPDNDPRGVWKSSDLSVARLTEKDVYPITTPKNKNVLPPNGRSWVFSKEKFQELLIDNRIWFGSNEDATPSYKRFLSEVKDGVTPMTIWKYTEVGHTQDATKQLKELFDNQKFFDYPKTVGVIKKALQLSTANNDIILDFFSGSATTAHAVMQLNADDGGNRKYIMVQIPEKCDEKSEAFKAGYANICEIGKERIRRAGNKIKEAIDKENTQLTLDGTQKKVPDIGFRVLKVDSTNMTDVYYSPNELKQNMLFNLEQNIKPDRTPEDLLFQVMLDLGILLSESMEEIIIDNKKVFSVADNYLIACFDKNITEKTIEEIAKRKPHYFVMRDSSMANDSVAANFDQLFETYSPHTVRNIV